MRQVHRQEEVGWGGVGDGQVFRKHFEVLLNTIVFVSQAQIYIEKVKT